MMTKKPVHGQHHRTVYRTIEHEPFRKLDSCILTNDLQQQERNRKEKSQIISHEVRSTLKRPKAMTRNTYNENERKQKN